MYQKLLKSLYFSPSYSKNKKRGHFWDTVYNGIVFSGLCFSIFLTSGKVGLSNSVTSLQPHAKTYASIYVKFLSKLYVLVQSQDGFVLEMIQIDFH